MNDQKPVSYVITYSTSTWRHAKCVLEGVIQGQILSPIPDQDQANPKVMDQ